MEFGVRSSPIYCRIYNKSLEVKEKRTKIWFYDIWAEHGLSDKEVWNIEFELHREFFTAYNIESVEDLFNHLSSIWDRCTKEWLVLIINGRTRIENCDTNPVWKQISDCFNDYVSLPLIKKEKQIQAEADALLPSTIGNLTSLAARLGISEPNKFFDVIRSKGEKYLNNKNHTYESKIDEKMSLL